MRNGSLAGLTTAALLWSIVSSASAQQIDEATLHVRLFNPDAEGGYVVRVGADVHGLAGAHDMLRVDVKQGGRTLASSTCSPNEIGPTRARFECSTESAPRLTATGRVTIDLVYLDDARESARVLRTVDADVRGYPFWVRDEGSRHVVGTMYQLDGSTLLGTAFATMEHPELSQTTAEETQRVRLYTAFAGTYEGFDSTLRCRVGDERIPDIEVSTLAFGEIEVDEWTSPSAERRRIGWYRARLEMNGLWWGRHIPGASAGFSGEPVFLGDHPGLWSCDMRSEGAVLRTFRFRVDADGRIAPHAAEADPALPRLLPGEHLVDVRIPGASPRDAYLEPASIRAGYLYGVPWPSVPAIAEMLAALPPARGSSAPSARAGGGGASSRRGRR